MESNEIGADERSKREHRIAEKRAFFDRIRQEIGDAKPISREELEKKIAIIREGNRKRREERERGQQTPPDITT